MKWEILQDIVPNGWTTPFPRHRSFIDYDAKHTRAKKWHQLVYQQGDHYGMVGDMAVDIRHDTLLDWERRGIVRRRA